MWHERNLQRAASKTASHNVIDEILRLMEERSHREDSILSRIEHLASTVEHELKRAHEFMGEYEKKLDAEGPIKELVS